MTTSSCYLKDCNVDFLRNILLFVVAVLLLILLAPIAVLIKVIIAIRRGKFDSEWFKRLALSLDQLGNVIADDFFNWLLIRDDGIAPFGDEDETVSSVLGKNYLAGNLTVMGKALRYMLHMIDNNHSVKSIED